MGSSSLGYINYFKSRDGSRGEGQYVRLATPAICFFKRISMISSLHCGNWNDAYQETVFFSR